MEGLRRRLRAWSFAWLICQVAFLSAFLPRECCAAHHSRASGSTPECHRTVKDTHCPMPSADGSACPMHQAKSGDEDCRLRGMCDGPLSLLAHLLSAPSLPVGSLTVTLAMPPTSIVSTIAENALQQVTPPDSPPPRL